MAEPKMRIRPFSVKVGGERVAEVLQGAFRRDPSRRNKPTSAGEEIRIDDLREVEEENLWLMNFVRTREAHGPVRVSKTEVTPVPYDPGQSPGEETAVLFIPETNHMLVQMTGYFRVAAIRDYINMVAGEPFCDLEPLSDDAAYRKFRAGGKAKRVMFALDTRFFTDTERKEGYSVKAAMQLARKNNASIVEIKMSAKGGQDLDDDVVQSVGEMLDAYQRCMRANDSEESEVKESGVKKLEVALLDPDRKMEVLNLLSPMMEAAYAIPLDKGRRFPLEDRYNALRGAYTMWRDILRKMRPPS